MDKETYYDVVIIGNTIAAFSLASQLDKEPGIRILWIKTKEEAYLGDSYPDLYPGFDMSYARFLHARGESLCNEMHQYSKNAYDFSLDFLKNLNVKLHPSKFVRVSGDHFEKEELEKSYEGVSKILDCSISNSGNNLELSFAAHQFSEIPLNKKFENITSVFTEVDSIDKDHDQWVIKTELGLFRCEIPVMLSESTACRIDSFLRKSLVAVSDQFSLISKSNLAFINTSKKHSYLWVSECENKTVVGGARFLRKLTGVGQTSPEYSREIENYLLNEFNLKDFASKTSLRKAFTEYISKDELPLLGSIGGYHSGWLVAASKMSRSICLDIYFGKVYLN